LTPPEGGANEDESLVGVRGRVRSRRGRPSAGRDRAARVPGKGTGNGFKDAFGGHSF